VVGETLPPPLTYTESSSTAAERLALGAILLVHSASPVSASSAYTVPPQLPV
jgi:hypothetical protein